MIWENVQLAISSLRSNKMRALLTMLGIIIGIMSIITIVIIGDAMTSSVSGSLASLGASNITVSVQERGATQNNARGGGPHLPGQENNPTSSSGKTPSTYDLISDQMIADMKNNFPDEIQGVSISHSGGNAKVQEGERYANITINGVNQDFFLANNMELLSGRFLSDSDVNATGSVAVVSDKLVSNMFPEGTDPIGQQVKLFKSASIELFTIIGIYKHEQMGFGGSTVSDAEISTVFYIPVTTAKQDMLEKNYTSITVIGAQDGDVHKLTGLLQQYFDGLYKGNTIWKTNVSNMASMLDTIADTLGIISLAIAFIAGISLLVGGIGVMNIMLVSVTERTREIGTRKALGAKNYHIQFQFVMEALIIALIGGIIGLLLGIGLGALVSSVLGADLVLSPVVIVGSMVFSVVIGVFFGIYPANKAARLDPIEALRYE